ncbi:MAG: OsmC family protein [Planctomycetota bacterium]|jgi:uncharacterized OsmC-like protein
MTTTSSSKLNGIDVAALEQLVADVQADPKHGKLAFGVTSGWKGGARTDTRVTSYRLGDTTHPRDFTISVDEPPELLGSNQYPNPQEHLMAALNACMMAGYVANASAMGIQLELLEIETSGELDLRGFLGIDADVKPGYEELHYTVRIKGDGTPEQFEELHRNVVRTSVNRDNLANPIRITSDLVIES